MKKIIVLVIIVTVILLTKKVVINPIKRIDLSNIKYIHFSYSTGTMINSNVYYYVDKKDGKYVAEIKPDQKSEEEKKTIVIDKDTLNKIINVLEKYDVYKWNGFHKSDKYVLDGDSFSMYIKTEEDKEIEASGYMMWPINYNKVSGELDSIFMDLYNSQN